MRIVVYDNLCSGFYQNVPRADKVRFVKGDILSAESLHSTMKGSDFVFHLAENIPNSGAFGVGHVVKYSNERPVEHSISTRGTINVLESCRRHDASLLYASSAAVYGQPARNPVKETSVTAPLSIYGASKLVGEVYCDLYSRLYGLRISTVRFFNVYGPKARKYVIYDILKRLAASRGTLKVLGKPSNCRDFVYVTDAVAAVLIVAGVVGRANPKFNVGSGRRTSMHELTKLIQEEAGSRRRVVFSGESWPGDVKSIIADPAKIQELGFTPKVSIRQGIGKVLEWLKTSERIAFSGQ